MIFKIDFYKKINVRKENISIMNVKKALGEKIKRLRKQRNLTQEELAEMIDIAPRNLSRIEVGANFVTAETLEKILTALDINMEEIFENDYIKEPEELLADINSLLAKIKNNHKKLEIIYKMIGYILES